MVAIVNGRRVQSGGRAGIVIHGMSYTKIYAIWADMVRRCVSPRHQRWADYGGRGITVCERWREFANFYTDMGDRPIGRSLDRINNDAGYSPTNCRWATPSEQIENRRPRRTDTTTCRHGTMRQVPTTCTRCAADAYRVRLKRRSQRVVDR